MPPKKKSKSKKCNSAANPPPVDLDAPNQELEEQLLEVGAQLEGVRIWGHAGGGLVKIEMDGMMHVLQCQLDPELLEKKDRELIEDLLTSAFNDAADKVRQYAFTFLPFTLADEEDIEDADAFEAAKMLAQDKDFMEQLGDPFVASFIEMVAGLKDEQDEKPPPKRKK